MSPTNELAIQIMEAMDKKNMTITFGEAVKIALRILNNK